MNTAPKYMLIGSKDDQVVGIATFGRGHLPGRLPGALALAARWAAEHWTVTIVETGFKTREH